VSKYIKTIILTDDPRQWGDMVRLEGADFNRLVQHGFVHSDNRESLDSVIGRPVSVKAVDVSKGVKGYELTFMLLTTRLKPGRYGIAPAGLVRKRSEDMVLECQIVSTFLTTHPSDPNCFFNIEEETNEA
jgi:hypothetical protein